MRKADHEDAPFPAPLLVFLELFEAGRYWDSHEALEDAWRANRSDFYQGLILYASAWVHWQRGNAHGVEAQLGKALDRLETYPDAYLGIDVEGLRSHCRAARREVERVPDEWMERVAPLRLTVTPGRLRGDEVELSS